MSLVRALKWSFLSEIAAKAIQPIIFIVVARLLTPEDFGVLTAALMVISFAQVFWDAGVGKALIQRQTDVEEASNATFWINVVVGMVVALLLAAAAGPITRTFFHDDRVILVLRVMTLQILLGAVSAVHVSLLQKDFGFQKLFWVRFVSVAGPGVASIPLAWAGMGYWALVAGTLVGQLAQTLILWRMSPWRPTFRINLVITKEIGRFGAWVGFSGLLGWFYAWADALIVGTFLGSHELGLYRTGSQFAMMAFFVLFGPIKPVLYSYLSRLSEDREKVGRILKQLLRILIVSAIPIAIALFVLGDPVGKALFGPKWNGIGEVIGIMALVQGVSWIVGMNPEVYRAVGKPSYETIIYSLLLGVYLVGFLFSIREGLTIFLWVRLALGVLALLAHLIVVRLLIKIPLLSTLLHIAFVTAYSTAVSAAVFYAVGRAIQNPWLNVAVSGCIIAACLGAIIYLTERNVAIRDLTQLYRKQASGL